MTMSPRISAKFRTKNGIPYAIERLNGTQYRCRICNQVFYYQNELYKHLRTHSGEKVKVSAHAPKLDHNLEVKVIYTLDLYDHGRSKYLKLGEGEEYDNPYEE